MASRLAVIAPLYGQRAAGNLPRIRAALAAQTRPPDEVWWMVEDVPGFPLRKNRWNVPTPRDGDRYAVIPYSFKQNFALDRTDADYIAYLTDDSWPAPEKYERMVRALDENPEWGAVYCSQEYAEGQVRVAGDVMYDAHCRVDHTQVMHRRTADRWPLEMGDLMLGDALFWRRLHASLGPFYPVIEVLDYVRQTREGISGAG